MKQASLIPTAKEMSKAFYQHTFQRYEIVAPNIYFETFGTEMDIFAARKSGYIDEIEIKISKSDFLADFKKTVTKYERGPEFKVVKELKHDLLRYGKQPCNYFSFLITEELYDQCEIPEYAGLYVYYRTNTMRGYSITEKKRAPLLHKEKITAEQKYNVIKKMAYRYWDLIK